VIRRRIIPILLAAACGWALAAAASAQETKTLLTPSGTIYQVRTGLYSDLEPGGTKTDPANFVIMWSAQDQTGATRGGIVAGTEDPSLKQSVDIAYDAPTDSLFVGWEDNYGMVSGIQFAILRSGSWTDAQLFPGVGITFAYNPQLLITHQTVLATDDQGNTISYDRAILSVIWWEESSTLQARYAPIFIENGQIQLDDVQVYSLPELVGSEGASSPGQIPAALYTHPTLQQDGLSSDILATFVDLNSQMLRTLRISAPSDLRNVPPDQKKTPSGRGHIIVVGRAGDAPIGGVQAMSASPVETIVGLNYKPTLAWQDGAAVYYMHFNGRSWDSVNAIPLTGGMTTEHALDLLRTMAMQN
jgi:hypothetical protein